ncbi:MAG: hypothetical protein WAX77_00485 [Methylococcaceae bacterium]
MCKPLTFWTLFILSVSTTAQAGILLEKVNYPGFVMDSYAATKHCAIHDNGQLSLDYQLTDLYSKQSLPLKFSRAAIKNKIALADTGTINTEIFPVDANTVIYRAYLKQSDASIKTVLLYEENGGSGQKHSNTSEAAITLKNFIDLNCEGSIKY